MASQSGQASQPGILDMIPESSNHGKLTVGGTLEDADTGRALDMTLPLIAKHRGFGQAVAAPILVSYGFKAQ